MNRRSNEAQNADLGNYQPSFTNLTNPIPETLVGNGPPLGGAYQPTKVDGADIGSTNQINTNLDELSEIKERIDAGVTYCRKHRDNDRLHGKGYARLTRILVRDYLPALDALKTAYPIEQLEQEREAIIGRMETGWQLADSESRARTFAKLLARYEVLTDALDGDVLARHLGRAE